MRRYSGLIILWSFISLGVPPRVLSAIMGNLGSRVRLDLGYYLVPLGQTSLFLVPSLGHNPLLGAD